MITQEVSNCNCKWGLTLSSDFIINDYVAVCWLGVSPVTLVKNLPASAGDAGSIPGWKRSPGGGNSNPLWYFCLENPMDRGPWQASVHGVAKELDTTEQLNGQQVHWLDWFH